MPFDWGDKLLELVFGGVPGMVKILPPHWRRQATARMQDFNPFAAIAANEDLLRALRLAWIEAALDVDAAVLQVVVLPEWQPSAAEANRFSAHLRELLRQLRHDACNRNVHPGSTAIDVHLDEVLVRVPDYLRAAAGDRPGDVLTRRFVPNVSSLTGWPEREVPTLYARLASHGLPIEGGTVNRAFGELVFSAFAELIKNPNRYPEAGVAFEVAMAGMARELAQSTLTVIGGIESKIDALLIDISALPARTEGIGAYLERADMLWAQRWAEMTRQVARVEDKLDESASLAALRHDSTQSQMQQLLAAVQALGQVGPGQNQLAYDTVFALARRLRPDELFDFERAVRELEFAIGVALQVMAQGERNPGHEDRFVDDVMQRVAELTEAGHLEQGAASIDDALAELDRREAEQRDAHRLSRVALLEGAGRQGVLLRDTDRVVNAVVALAALSEPLRPAGSDEFGRMFEAFYGEGSDLGINFSLEVAIALARLRVSAMQTSDQHAESLVWLGNALWALGQREAGTVRLDGAVQAYRLSLEAFHRDSAPTDWAAVQNNLGNALSSLGMRERGTARLEAAVHAYRAALGVHTRDHVPLDWAMTQNNLGNVFWILGERESGTTSLLEALQAYRAALEERPREQVPMDWAATQNNMGNALAILGEREQSAARLAEAAQAYRAALEEITRQGSPLEWAMTQNNLGYVLSSLGGRESGTTRLEDAVKACRAALAEYTRQRVPLDWAMTQNNLGKALWLLGTRESGTERLEDAVQAFRASLEERSREQVPLDWAATQNNLGDALTSLGERQSGTARFEEAMQAYRAALEEFDEDAWPERFAAISERIAALLKLIEERRDGA